MTDFDKIFTGGISYYGLLPRKISSKSEHFKYQKLCAKIQNSGKKNPKIVFGPETLPWYGRHLWTMGWNSFRGLLVMPKKNLVTLRAFFGCQITIYWRPLDQKSKNLPIFGLFSTCNLGKSRNIAQKLFMHLLWTLTKTPEKIFDVQNFLSTKIFAKTGFFRV